jgi:hypothetical protein
LEETKNNSTIPSKKREEGIDSLPFREKRQWETEGPSFRCPIRFAIHPFDNDRKFEGGRRRGREVLHFADSSIEREREREG